ncbi:MAG: DUF4290 domain-containing protein [Bacteroidales bacterium]|nr:DUF4290 domain-containing protein [Bacteroidales bacterium]
MILPEYGRKVQEMVEHLLTISDREKRSQQALAVVKAMEILNPQVKQQEDWQRKLWDHLFIISRFELDVDSPFPAPEKADLDTKPEPVPLQDKPIKARHYGRNIESIIDLIARQEDGPLKTQLILCLALYMRRQYLIWNKDTVSDETIFKDIELISKGTVKVPEGLSLTKLSPDANYYRPGFAPKPSGRNSRGRRRNFQNKKQ